MVADAALFFSALRPPDRDAAPGARERLRDAEPDTAIAAGDDGDAAGEIEDAHLGVPFGWAHFRCASDGGLMLWPNHGQGPLKNQIWV